MNTSATGNVGWTMTAALASVAAAAVALCMAVVSRAQTPPGPGEYVPPGPVTARGLAPALKVKQLGSPSGTHAVIFGEGDEVASGLTEFAETQQIKAGHLTGIGAFSSAVLAYFDREKKAYKTIVIDEQVEVLSFIGDFALDNGKPALHAHVVVGFPDGSTKGGHLLEARVWPTLEVFVTELPHALVKTHDPESGLDLIDPSR
jgi:predicted DNA-binding protein with PD1-like motif